MMFDFGMRHVKSVTLLLACLLTTPWLAGCNGNDDRADAYGTFEAAETLISSEANGRLLRFEVDEGDSLIAGQMVGLVDTVQLALQRDQLQANRRAVQSRTRGVVAQVDVLQEQKRVAEIEQDRLEKLVADQAAPQKQLDDINGQIRVLNQQIQQIRTQNAPILAEIDAIDAQIAQIADQIRRLIIINPIAGTVLVTYAEPHEMTAHGKPLYKIADLSTLTLRAYVSGDQLPHIRLGQSVEVQIDETRTENRSLPGEIVSIASEAEFTPRIIQTKEERVNLVYAIKVRVANPDGALKIGMPGEVWLGSGD
jgi:HlyD family secretion protein